MASVTRRIRKTAVLNKLRQLAPHAPIWQILKAQKFRFGRLAMAEYMIRNDLIPEFAKKAVEAMKAKGIPVETEEDLKHIEAATAEV